MMHGLPGDAYERSIEYARRLQALRPDYVMYNHAIPFPGTELYNWVEEHGQFRPGYTWKQTRDFAKAAFWTPSFDEKQRVESFRVIQTIVHVINFASENQKELDDLVEEIKEYDPDYLDYHMAYLKKSLGEGLEKKNLIKKIHREDQIERRAGYTGCVDVKTLRMV